MYKRVLGYFKRYEYPENITVILSQLYTLNGHVHLKKGVRDMSVIFFNVFYMQHYNGSEEGLEGGFNFDSVDANGDIVAGEIFNFRAYDGWYYGYAPYSSVKLERVAPNETIQKDEQGNRYLSGVTVIFMATYPGDATRVVGWYENAILYEKRQEDGPNRMSDNLGLYLAKARAAVCLPEEDRVITVQRAAEYGLGQGYGQCPVWYADADTPYVHELRTKVLNFIEAYRQGQRPVDLTRVNESDQRRPIEQQIGNDPGFNRLIEQRAVREAVAYYQGQGFVVEDVQKENCGWDLTVSRENTEFFVEVKGNAADIPHLCLTPNEYRTLQNRYRQYRIISVTGCRDAGGRARKAICLGRNCFCSHCTEKLISHEEWKN